MDIFLDLSSVQHLSPVIKGSLMVAKQLNMEGFEQSDRTWPEFIEPETGIKSIIENGLPVIAVHHSGQHRSCKMLRGL